jgi:1,4-dihydroxy-2-naphthoate octaprenyltransferase
LVVNNYRDIDSDRAANKRTLIVRFGRGFGAAEYLLMLAVAQAVPLLHLYMGRGAAILLPFVSLPAGLRMYALMRRAATRAQFDKALGGTALYMLGYSMLLALGLVL